MKNMISDKKTVPVPGRGERIDGGKTLRGKKIVLTAVCVALTAALCCAGVIGASAEVEGLASQEKVTPVRLKDTAEAVLKNVNGEDALKEIADKVASKGANDKDVLEKVVAQYDAAEQEEPRKLQQKNGQPKISSQQEDQQKKENDPVEKDMGHRIIEETAEGEGAHQSPELQNAYAEDDDHLQTPVEAFTVSSPYGPRWGSFHSGIDLALAQGNPIYAADSGTVIFSGYSGGYGNMVKIDHGNGMQTNYAHCSQLSVTQGQQVECGETIALVGSTGNSTGPHLHFEIIIDGNCVDPAGYLDLE